MAPWEMKPNTKTRGGPRLFDFEPYPHPQSFCVAEVMTHTYLLARGMPEFVNRIVWVPGGVHVPWGPGAELDVSASTWGSRLPLCMLVVVKQFSHFGSLLCSGGIPPT